jgi:hypothetical protein
MGLTAGLDAVALGKIPCPAGNLTSAVPPAARRCVISDHAHTAGVMG